MTTTDILADHDRATDLGVAPTTCPVAWFCTACDQPAYVGQPDDICDHCGHKEHR